jgi:hypothetical protein
MPIPKQVQAQASEAEELSQKLYGEAPEKEVDTAPQAEVVEPEAKQELTPTREPASEVVAEKVEAEKPDEEGKVWKQKYKTLQGMYDAEVPRLHQQVKDLTSKLDDLVSQVKASDKAVEEAKEQAKHEQLQNLVTDEDRQEFGDDLIAISRKIAREESAELYKQLEAVQSENNQLREMLEQTGSKVTQTSFEQELHRLVPDFVQVNTDPNWIKWLDEHDPLLRAPRRVVAEKSFSEGDADSVAHFVNLFKNSQQEADPAKQVVDKEIESQIQPSKSTSSPSTPAPKGKTYTNDQIRAMFVKITHMQKAGKSDEARKLEAEIDAAYMEGRVAA